MLVDWDVKNLCFVLITETIRLMSHKAFCFIQTNRARYSMIFNTLDQIFQHITAILFVKHTRSKKFREKIFFGEKVNSLALLIVN